MPWIIYFKIIHSKYEKWGNICHVVRGWLAITNWSLTRKRTSETFLYSLLSYEVSQIILFSWYKNSKVNYFWLISCHWSLFIFQVKRKPSVCFSDIFRGYRKGYRKRPVRWSGWISQLPALLELHVTFHFSSGRQLRRITALISV